MRSDCWQFAVTEPSVWGGTSRLKGEVFGGSLKHTVKGLLGGLPRDLESLSLSFSQVQLPPRETEGEKAGTDATKASPLQGAARKMLAPCCPPA